KQIQIDPASDRPQKRALELRKRHIQGLCDRTMNARITVVSKARFQKSLRAAVGGLSKNLKEHVRTSSGNLRQFRLHKVESDPSDPWRFGQRNTPGAQRILPGLCDRRFSGNSGGPLRRRL